MISSKSIYHHFSMLARARHPRPVLIKISPRSVPPAQAARAGDRPGNGSFTCSVVPSQKDTVIVLRDRCVPHREGGKGWGD